MTVTSRDVLLFKKLSTHGMLSTRQIGFLFFRGVAKTTVLRRLRALESKKYLQRVLGLESQEVLWVLTEKGATQGEVLIPKRHYSKNLLEHDFKLVSLRLALEGSGIAHSWIAEHEIRSSIFRKHGFRTAKEKLIPDGIMGIEVDQKKQSLAIELELTLKNKDKLKRTITRYKEKEGILGVWYIAPTTSILNSILSTWRGMRAYQNEPDLYLSVLSDVMKAPLEVKVFENGKGKLAKTLWTPKPAHSPDHRVSRKDQNQEYGSIDVSANNHAPILKVAS